MKLICLFIFIPVISLAQLEKEKLILSQMLRACDNLKSASFILSTAERQKDGSIEKGEMLTKLQRAPHKMYLHLYKPNAGTELLYRKDEWDNDLYISPGGFPYINLKMNQGHTKVRRNSHHVVSDIGFDYLTKLIKHYQGEFGDRLYDYLTLGDTIQFERHRCMRMEFDYIAFGYIMHIAKDGEDITEIASNYFVNEYMIVCANKNVDHVLDVKAGDQIRVPNMFGRKIIFYVDIRSMLPLVQEIHDEKGLFERYEYRSFVLNPEFDKAEFTPEFGDYGF